MDNQQPTNAPDHSQAPVFDGTLPHSPAPKSRRSLAIALVVSTIFLLAAAGVATWLMLQPQDSQPAQAAPSGDGSSEVTSANFTAPADFPATYVRRDENTTTGQTTFYDDAQTLCGFIIKVRPLASGTTPKDATVTASNEAKDAGITTTANAAGDTFAMADADGKHKYNFSSLVMQQSVSAPGVAVTAQQALMAYKQFGTQVATIGYTCPTDKWEAKKAELDTLLKTFKVTTKR